MPGLQTVVAATDLSPASAPALIRAADLARRTGADLHVLFAHLLFRADGAASGGRAEGVLRLQVERFAAETLGVASADLGLTVAIVRDVSAPEAIARYAESADADVLVVGTHGRTGLGRLLLGSVAERCVGIAPCPVMAVPARSSEASPGSDAPIVVPIDFSERSRAALTVATSLAARYDAPIEVVHVVHDAGPYPDLVPDYVSLSDIDPEAGERCRARLMRLAPEASGVHVLMGSPSRVLPHLAESLGAGLLVMGTHGRRGAAHALLGSVAEATLRRAPCPVLTLRTADLTPPKRLPSRPSRLPVS
ncbi:MAG: universal stress protein [Bacteroidota bacterium]